MTAPETTRWLVLGGDGALVNALCDHLPPSTLVAGRTRPRALAGQAFVRFDAEAPDLADLEARISAQGGVDVVLNAIGHCGSSLFGYGLNVSSARTAAELARRLEVRLLHISSLKCDRRAYTGDPEASPYPYSPYAWSKLCGELVVESVWSESSILRLAYLDDAASAHYYTHRLTVDRLVKTVSPTTVWQTLQAEARAEGLRRVSVQDDAERLPAFARRLGPKRLLVPVPRAVLGALRSAVSTKIFDYVPHD